MSPSIMTWSLIIGIATIVIPILAVAAWKIYSDAKIWLAFLGAAVYFLFGQIILTVLNSMAFAQDKFNIDAKGGILVYIVYMALITAICEEGGKFIFFKLILKPCEEKVEAITMGLGFAGLAGILTLGSNCYMYRMVYNYVQTGDSTKVMTLFGTQTGLDNFVTTLSGFTGGTFLLMLVQQLCMMAFAVAATFFVFMAARYANKSGVLLIIVVVHGIIMVPSLLNNAGILPLWASALITLAMAVVVVWYAVKEYKVYVNTHNYDPSKSRWNRNRPQTEVHKGPQKGGTKKKHK